MPSQARFSYSLGAGKSPLAMRRQAPASLSGSAARGVLWTGTGQVLRQLVQIGTSLVLVRLLVPEDFGLIGMAMFFIGIGQLLADFGMGAAIMHSRTDDQVILSSCFWLNVVVAAGLAAVLLVAAPLIGDFYKRSDLVPIVAALALNLLLSGLLVVPAALLTRDMRFAVLARSQVLGSLVGAAAAIVMAWRGFGAWALVAQPLCGAAATLSACTFAARWYPSFQFSWRKVEPLARFSAALLGTNLIGYMNRNADSLLVGRVLGAGPLGYYSMAIQLMLYPLQQVSSVFVRVLIPTLIHLQEDLPRLRAAYLKAVGCIALATFPIMGGLFAVADDFVKVVFGPTWTEMTPLVEILAWVGMFQSVGTTVGTLYLATGNPRLALRVTMIGAPILIGGMAAGLPWGTIGVATGYAIANVTFSYYSFATAFRLVGLPLLDFWRELAPPLGCALAMIAVVMLAGQALSSLDAPYRLGLCVLLGVLAYIIATLFFNRARVVEMMTIARSLRKREA